MGKTTLVRDVDHAKFETRFQIEEYIGSLNDRILPFKFAYIGSAAYTHDELIRSPEYGLADAEADLITSRFLIDVAPYLSERTSRIVDVGSGNGMKGVLVYQELRKQFTIANYVALDYSQTLLKIAKATLLKNEPSLNIDIFEVDFETAQSVSNFRRVLLPSIPCSLFLFLGHTLGNPANRLQVLSNIRSCMKSGDKIMIGVELYRQGKEFQILEHYQNEAFFRAIFTPLTFAGFKRSDGEIIVTFNETTRDVVVRFDIRADLRIRTTLSEDIVLKSGDDLQIGISHRFERTELSELLLSAGFDMHTLILNRDESYALVVAGA